MAKELGSSGQQSLHATDDGSDGTHFSYAVRQLSESGGSTPVELCRIKFQNGPIDQAGVNGVTDEAVIQVLIDHIGGFQTGKYASQENFQAVQHLKEALQWLRMRGNTTGAPAPGKK